MTGSSTRETEVTGFRFIECAGGCETHQQRPDFSDGLDIKFLLFHVPIDEWANSAAPARAVAIDRIVTIAERNERGLVP